MDFYIGKPYSLREYNCWDHVAKIRKDNGIKTKSFTVKNLSNAFDVITAEMQKLGSGLTKVDELKDFDIVIVSQSKNERPSYHCGLYYKGSVAHCSRELKQAVYEPLSVFKRGSNGVTFWR